MRVREMGFEAQKESIVDRLKHKPLLLAAASTTRLSYGKAEIARILPHRQPVDFIDSINALDLGNELIEVTSLVAKNDPVFAGHFPDHAVYPGIYQIETMGQAALCLTYFVQQQSVVIAEDCTPIRCLFTRVHNVGFVKLINPGDALTVRATVLERDETTGIVGAQILIKEQIYSHAVLQANFL